MPWAIEQTGIGRIVIPPSLPEGLALFYTTIDFDGRLTDGVAGLMGIVRDRFGIDATLATCTQVHGKSVVHAPADKRWRECDSCDALWSSTAGTALGIKVADCLPVSIIDAKNSVIANIHSGWRGTVQNITAKTLKAMRFDATASFAYLGPTIRVCCFEVGEEVAAQFDAQFIDRARGPKPHVDIAAYTTAVLRGYGVENVIDTGLCTRCDGSLFHSYRRDKRTGRNLAIVAQ